jgi:superfamily II DNA or RNA helicase
MARHHISDPRIQAVIGRLADQFVRLGSVNALADALTSAQPGGSPRIYPNRLHGLLSEDRSRSINSATLEAIDRGLAALESDGGAGDGTVRQRVMAATAQTPTGTADPAAFIAAATGVPPAVVKRVTDLPAPPVSQASRAAEPGTPDWSWQDDAVARSVRALGRRPGYKAGLVVPTGGGKTRIALRIALRWLEAGDRDDTVVLWVTHRRRLHLQARRALQQLLRDGEGVPDNAASLFASRIRFIMIGDLAAAIPAAADRLSLIIVDEAHHAAAPSYEPLFAPGAVPGLFLTATPNRADALPIGIDEVAYTITYRELFRRNCLTEPVFEPPLDLSDLDWSKPDGLRDLADYLLDRTDGDFGKVLVTVSTRDRAENLYEALVTLLDERPGNPLSFADIGFVHAERSSGGVSTADFLDEFTARPTGVLVATAQLVGEGYDDPSIDAVVVTYPSTSISHLHQVAGRALRTAPGKRVAHVVQLRESPIEYHFDQRWLYQDISDQLRPELIDRTYGSAAHLTERIRTLLEQHRVPAPVAGRIERQLQDIGAGTAVQLILTGVPYFGPPDTFEAKAEWGAVLITPEERDRFVEVFNDVSARIDDIKEHGLYLARHLSTDSRAGSLWKSYVDLVTAMEYARREITSTPYAGDNSRPYRQGRSTTWLRYISFRFEPVLPAELDQFLRDAFNRDAVIAEFLQQPGRWVAAVKIELPLAGTMAYLLADAGAQWIEEQRRVLAEQLRDARGTEGFAVLTRWAMGLGSAPVPPALLAEMSQLTRPERFAEQYLPLATAQLTRGEA